MASAPRAESPGAKRGLRQARIAVAMVAVLAAGSGFAGIRKSLPYAPEGDESIFVGSAARMAASGSLDPQWFGHPGSTIFYPLAFIYTIANVSPFRTAAHPAEPAPWSSYTPRQSWYYFAARALTISYFVASIPLVYLIGRFVFSGSVGVIGASFAAVIPLSVSYAQFVRTDSAATFFGLLAIWCMFRSLDEPSPRRQIIAGIVAGLAVASRYFMAALVPVWILSQLLGAGGGGGGGQFDRRQVSRTVLQGVAAAILAFLLATPYVVLHTSAVVRDLGLEMELTHLGADGLSPLGNLRWYLTRSLPEDLSWPIALFALAGLAAVLARPRRRSLILAAFPAAFLLALSSLHTHWHRWTIEILPICCLFAAHGLERTVGVMRRVVRSRLTLGPPRRVVLVGLMLALLAQPAYQLARHDLQQIGAGTRMQARAWISEHIPAGSKIIEERYAAPLQDLPFDLTEQQSLALEGSLHEYSRRGYQYAIVSSAIYLRFMAEPARYPHQSAFYSELFATREPIKSFPPLPHTAWLPAAFATDCYCSGSQTRGEPTIRVYRVD